MADLPRSRSALIAENALLRQQLVILRRQVKRPRVERHDRFWLLALANRVVSWRRALVIIQPGTLLRWHRQGFHLFWRQKSRPKATKPEIPRETIELIQRMAKENLLWGAERIQGELLKLGIRVAKRTVQRYVRPVRLPGESRQTWSTFLKTHAGDIWACDCVPVIDLWFRPLSFSSSTWLRVGWGMSA